ncbi:MAG TPA: TIGR00341 family protein [Ginsengibacter sp.]
MTNLFNKLFSLYEGQEDKNKTLQNVKDNISFTGANLWVLACAIIVASVGLNINSTAVVIGAMLISPLMGPIVGSGFALGIYDFALLKRSLRNLLNATFVGLSFSTLYFYISPFKEAQSELLARTSPNIYDVLIAFFGGLVGVIAVTRTEKGNPIAGVAIATALMPPLCTAGYGLATGHFIYFFGSLFLYCINCVFICIATYIIVKFLKYPAKQIGIKHEKRLKYGITTLTFLMLLPSAYFAYSLYNQQKFKESVNAFIDKEFNAKGNTLIYKRTNYNSDPKTIELAFLSRHFTGNEIKTLNDDLKTYGVANTKLIIRQDSAFNIQNIKNDILNEVKGSDTIINQKDIEIRLLKDKIASNSFDNKEILKEVSTLFPDITAISLANHDFYTSKDSSFTTTILFYESPKELSDDDKVKFENWIRQRLSIKNLEIYKK